MKRISRKGTIKFIVAALVIFSLSVLAYSVKKPQAPESVMHKAEISLASGNVEKSEKEGTWVKTKSNESVSQGETIRVVGEGKAIIALDDGSAVRLNSNSVAKFASLNPKSIEIVNERGEIYSRVVKADRSFTVRVDEDSYAAIGTAYKTVNTSDTKGVLVYESKIRTKKDKLEVPQGKKLYQKNTTEKDKVNKLVDISKEEIEKDKFAQWNKNEDLKNEEFKKYLGCLETKNEPEPTAEEKETPPIIAPTTPTAGIYLTGAASSKGINFKWSIKGIDTSKGFKLVKSTSKNPVYPGNSATYISAGSSSYSLGIKDGRTYYFRICQYIGGGCGVYSNNIVVTAPKVVSGEVSRIDLYNYGEAQIKWLVSGFSENGFKVVWSKNPGPTYPNRGTDRYHYYSDPYRKIDTLEAFSGAGTYYVRVCEYLGGSCGVYSNEITISL